MEPPVHNSSATKFAIELIINNSDLRRVLLTNIDGRDDPRGISCFERKARWDTAVEQKAGELLFEFAISPKLQEYMTGLILLIGMKMLTWAEYHEMVIGFSREYSINFLGTHYFTPEGLIDSKKAALDLVKDNSLTVQQRYKVACLYCFMDRMAAFFREMSREDKKEFYDPIDPDSIDQPLLIRFWSYYLMGDIDKLRNEDTVDEYRLDMSLHSASKTAVEYCLEKRSMKRNFECMIDIALKCVGYKTEISEEDNGNWVIFKADKAGKDFLWRPSENYVDILSYIFSLMRGDYRNRFLNLDIRGDYYNPELADRRHSKVLEYFVDWPYQDLFMKNVLQMWDILPKRSFGKLLLKIVDKFSLERGSLKYGEERTFNYRGMFTELWARSPQRFKKYVLNDKHITSSDGTSKIYKEGKELLYKLHTLKKFIYEDTQNIRMILGSASCREKESIIFSELSQLACIDMIKRERWPPLNEFIHKCLLTKQDIHRVKKDLCYTQEVRLTCLQFLKQGNLKAADMLVRWSELPESVAKTYKIELINSNCGKEAFLDTMVLDKNLAREIVDFCYKSEENTNAYIMGVVSGAEGLSKCADLLVEKKIDLAEELISYGSATEEEKRRRRKDVGMQRGGDICQRLISHFTFDYTNRAGGDFTVYHRFQGGKWDEVDEILKWCFNSEAEIAIFKRRLHREHSREIHFELAEARQLDEAKTFFTWLGLSEKEINALKRETLYERGVHSFRARLFSDCDKKYDAYGDKDTAFKEFFECYLFDKEITLDFRNILHTWYGEEGKLDEGHKELVDAIFALDQFLNKMNDNAEEVISEIEKKMEEQRITE